MSEYERNDLLVLASNKIIRGWTYEIHCKYNADDDNTIVEILRTIWETER